MVFAAEVIAEGICAQGKKRRRRRLTHRITNTAQKCQRKRKERRGIREASNVCDHTLGKEEIRGINEGDPPKK